MEQVVVNGTSTQTGQIVPICRKGKLVQAAMDGNQEKIHNKYYLTLHNYNVLHFTVKYSSIQKQ